MAAVSGLAFQSQQKTKKKTKQNKKKQQQQQQQQQKISTTKGIIIQGTPSQMVTSLNVFTRTQIVNYAS